MEGKRGDQGGWYGLVVDARMGRKWEGWIGGGGNEEGLEVVMGLCRVGYLKMVLVLVIDIV